MEHIRALLYLDDDSTWRAVKVTDEDGYASIIRTFGTEHSALVYAKVKQIPDPRVVRVYIAEKLDGEEVPCSQVA